MKKMMLALLIAGFCGLNLSANDGFGCGVWFNLPKKVSSSSIDGIGLGLPVIANAKTHGASLALCGNNVQKMDGLQFALIGFNYARTIEGVQLGFINMLRAQHGKYALQWGFYNQSGENGIQIGCINNGQNNATFQLGLINLNKNGLLPVMIFVNFGKDFFDF